MFLKEDIHRFISGTELFLSNIRGLRYTGLKKVKFFFVGHPVHVSHNKLIQCGYGDDDMDMSESGTEDKSRSDTEDLFYENQKLEIIDDMKSTFN